MDWWTPWIGGHRGLVDTVDWWTPWIGEYLVDTGEPGSKIV